MSKGNVLVVGSNATRIKIRGGGAGPAGQYLNELVAPVMAPRSAVSRSTRDPGSRTAPGPQDAT